MIPPNALHIPQVQQAQAEPPVTVRGGESDEPVGDDVVVRGARRGITRARFAHRKRAAGMLDAGVLGGGVRLGHLAALRWPHRDFHPCLGFLQDRHNLAVGAPGCLHGNLLQAIERKFHVSCPLIQGGITQRSTPEKWNSDAQQRAFPGRSSAGLRLPRPVRWQACHLAASACQYAAL